MSARPQQAGWKGLGFSVRLRDLPYGSEFYLRDPNGYILGFVQPKPD